jgi:hypothetical protein
MDPTDIPSMTLLAQSGDTSDLILPTLIILVIIALLIASIAVIRKKMFTPADDPANDPMAGFSLSSLRQLVKQGKMTPEEFEAAKAQIVARAQRASEKQKPVENPAPETKIDPDEPI